MKNISILLFACLASLLLFACSTTKIAVSGKPGTVISDHNGQTLGTIAQDGQGQISVKRNNYYAFLLAKEPGAEYAVPFALNFKDVSGGAALAMAGTFGGLGAMLPGLILSTAGSKYDDNSLVTTGLITMLAGAAVMTPCALALSGFDTSNGFAYYKTQNLNGDLSVRTSGTPAQCNLPQNRLVSKPKASSKKKEAAAKDARQGGSPAAQEGPTPQKIRLHQSMEEAVAAAKQAIQDYPGILELRRTSLGGGLAAFDLYDGQTLVERHTYVENN